MTYRTLWVVRHVMPDDRLAYATVQTGVITLGLRHGHIHPALMRSMALFSKEFARSGLFDLDLAHVGERPAILAWFERVDEHFTDGEPMRLYSGGHGPWFFEILVRDDMVDESLIHEMNDEVMPTACGLLVPVNYADAE